MNNKLLVLLFLLIGIIPLCFASAASDYFRSSGSGTWSTLSIWESSPNNSTWTAATLVPTTAANVVTIRNGNTVAIGGATSIDQTVIEYGGQLSVSTGITLTIANGTGTDLTVNGILRNNAGTITTTGTVVFSNTGKYQHNFTTTAGTIPIATWDINSTCEIIGYTSNTNTLGGLGQSFGNFTWNCTNQTSNIDAGGALITVNGNLSINSTGSGQFRLVNGNQDPTMELGGDFSLTGGTFNMSSNNGAVTIINLHGNFTASGGTVTESANSSGTFNFAGTTAQIISITGSPTISNTINFNVNANAIVEFDTDTTVLGGSNGTFTTASGSTLIIKHAAGISSTGATGCIQTTGTRTFNTGAKYTYDGSAAQVTGNGLPATVNSLSIDNPVSVTLSGACTVSAALTLTTPLTIGANTLTIGGTVSGSGGLIGGTTSNLSVTGTGSIVLPAVSTLQNMLVNRTGGATVTLGSSVTLGGTLTLTTGLTIGANTLTINGTIPTVTGGLVGGSTSNIIIGAGAALALPAITSGLHDLSLSRGNTVTLGSSVAIGGTCTVTSGNLAVGAFTITINETIIFTATPIVSGAGGFVLSNGATLETANINGIYATTAFGSVQSTTRTFNVGGNYTYTGAATQVSGTGYPNLCTGTLKVNTGTGVSFSLSAARTLGTGGNVNLATGIFAGGNLSMGTNSYIIRSEGIMTGTISGATGYSVIYNGNSKTTGNELSGSGLGNITINLNSSSNTVTLDRNLTIDNIDVLSFVQGSLTLANFGIVMNGSYTGANLFIYSGTGILGGGNVGNDANIQLAIAAPTIIPSIVNTLEVSPGIGNTTTLPNDVTTTYLTFISGSLAFNGHTVTLANQDFAFTGSNKISDLYVAMTPTSQTYNGYTSIAHTWQTNGTFSGSLDIIFSYPSALSISPLMTVVNRDHTVGESPWTFVAMLISEDHDTYRSVSLPSVTTLNGSGKGDMDWTITETDQELPVELTSFTATLSQQTYITLEWVTQSETNEIGYNVFRNNIDDLSSASQVNANMISATNTSVEHTYFFRDIIVTDDDAYYYWLQDVSNSGTITFHGPVMVDISNGGHVTPPPEIPLVTSVQGVFPNPFTTSATISYGVAKRNLINIKVYNIKGQMVKTLLSQVKDKNNYHDLYWDGKDANGRTCASGVYYVELTSGAVKSVSKVLLLK